ncbi:MAG TPA: PAS domain S-box protein [Candidatus Ozemobacteraceae bacterium]|nr:PAS domain S-box protein [Candidatus Ozemobacteraceae bacterium]
MSSEKKSEFTADGDVSSTRSCGSNHPPSAPADDTATRASPSGSSGETVYRSLSEHLPGIVYRLYLREQNRMEFFNDMVRQITGYAAEELQKSRVLSIDPLIHQEDLDRVITSVSASLPSMNPYQIEYRIIHRDGSIRHLEERGRPIPGGDGFPLYVDGVIFDVTEKKNLEQMRKRYEFIVNTSREFMTMVRRDFVYEAVNEAYCQAHKKSREQIIGHTVTDVWGPEAFSRIRPYFLQCFEGKEVHYRFSFPFAALGMRYFDVTYYPYYGDDREVTHVIVVSRDMTRSHQMEVERDRLAIAIQQAAEGVLITDVEGTIEYVNPAFERISGYTSTELIGKNPRLFKSGNQPPATYEELWRTVKNGNVWKGHFINAKQDGSLYEAHSTISPVRDESGRIMHFVAVMNDITKEVALERQMRQSQKLEAIGTLAGGIAHDFNNILGAILGFADLTRVELDESLPVQDNLREIIQASRRAQELISQILTFSRRVEPRRIPLLLHQAAQEGMSLLRATVPKTVLIHNDFACQQTGMMGDPVQMHQILINLVTNAIQALPDGRGSVYVSVQPHLVTPDTIESDPLHLPAGKYVLLEVRDSGVGMDKEVLDRIFEPYFTTKPVGQGNGLGLAMVHGIVKEHDGHISVHSSPGHGTSFRIYFPACDVQPDSSPAREPVLSTSRGRILLVDDEPALMSFGRKALQHLGFEVEATNDSRAALTLLQEEPIRFDAIITDIAMPGLSGPDLIEELRKLNQDIPVFMMSGFGSGQISPENLARLKIKLLLKKPFSISDLQQALHCITPSASSNRRHL